MSGLGVAVRPRLPVPADRLVGAVLHIPAVCCRYRDVGLSLLVRRVRLDISQWYGGQWVWLEGHALAADGYSLGWVQVLVHVSACLTSSQGASASRSFATTHVAE